MIDALIAILGSVLVAYALLDLTGINLAYLIKYLVSREVRLRRRMVKSFINRVLKERLNLILGVLGINTCISSIGQPKIVLSLREVRRVGGRYFWGLHLIVLDVPRGNLHEILPALDHELTHYIQDILGIKGPKWFLEGMAAYVELKLHHRVRGYRRELIRFLSVS